MPHPEMDPGTALMFLAIGFIGAVVGSLALALERGQGLQLPRMYRRNEDGEVKTYFDPGFLASGFVGAFFAWLFDGRATTAGFIGIAIGFVGPAFIRPLLESAFKARNIPFSFDKPAGEPPAAG